MWYCPNCAHPLRDHETARRHFNHHHPEEATLRTELTQEHLKTLLHYDPDTGIWTWRVNRTGGVKAGMTAGYINDRRYRRIVVQNRIQYSHRLAWLYMTGNWPTQIDHKNGNKSDDRWQNLRIATHSQNEYNKPLGITNTSGFKGVSKNGNRWRAHIRINGKSTHLGRFPTKEEAAAAYRKAAIDLHGEYVADAITEY